MTFKVTDNGAVR